MRYSLLIYLLLGIAVRGVCQVEINDLKTPTAPGFVLLDKTPESVDKPTTPAALGVSILNLGNGGAFEVAPYWLKPWPKLTFDGYVNEKFPILKTLSISLATQVKTDTSHMGFGIRFNLYRFRSKSNKNRLNEKSKMIEDFLNEDMTVATLDSIKKHKKELLEFIDQPTLVVSVAGAYIGQADNEEFKNMKSSRFGVWMNLTYSHTHLKDFKAILLNRYVKNPNFSGYSTDAELYDLGLSLVYKKSKFGASMEYVNRFAITNAKDYNRMAGQLEFRLIDNLYLTGTLGKNFNDEKDLFVLFGINVGVSSKSAITL